MEKAIKERYSDEILSEAMARYGIAEDKIELLDGFESYIYAFERDGAHYILRIAHSIRRSVTMIRGEVDWINYLAAGGVGVARAVLSERGELVELIDDGKGGQFLATAFVKARGDIPRGEVWAPPLYERYGETMGCIHALSRDYEPGDPAWRRPEWDDPVMLEVESMLPPSASGAVEQYRALMAHLRALPRGPESYGLIHQDFHGGNFFVDEVGRITLFDFDDCVYGWYAYDVALVLFYAALWAQDPPAFTRQFMTHFLRGYQRECPFDPAWLQEFPHFLKLREIDLYAVIHRSFDVDKLEHPFDIQYMRGRQERIERGLPYIDFDFESLADVLDDA